MRIETTVVRLMTDVLEWHRSLILRRGEDPERGDVPGWVFVTMMSAALVGVLYVLAADRLAVILGDALDSVIP